MALTEFKLEYHRKYRKANKDSAKEAFSRWHQAHGKAHYYENIDLTRAIKRKSYYVSRGNELKAAEEQKLIEQLRIISPKKRQGPIRRLTDEQRAASLKRSMRKLRHKHVTGIPTLDAPEKCEICGDTKKICLDHCHETNEFRGWLCDRCNVILGRVDDNTEILAAMIVYLNEHKGER